MNEGYKGGRLHTELHATLLIRNRHKWENRKNNCSAGRVDCMSSLMRPWS